MWRRGGGGNRGTEHSGIEIHLVQLFRRHRNPVEGTLLLRWLNPVNSRQVFGVKFLDKGAVNATCMLDQILEQK